MEVPAPAAERQVARCGAEVQSVATEPRTTPATSAILGEPVPPPVAIQSAEVCPPPVWSPPPKSRAIIETPTSSAPPADFPASVTEPSQAEVATPQDANAPRPTEAAPSEPIPPPSEPDVTLVAPAAEPDFHAERAIQDRPVVAGSGRPLEPYILAFSMAAAAIFGMGPAFREIVQQLQAVETNYVARWAMALLGLGLVQTAYAVYFAQMPDWVSGWVVTLVSLLLAALYAGMLGMTLMAGDESLVIRGLQMNDVLASGRAPIWCLCMTTIMTVLAFFTGRMSLRWRLADMPG